MEDHDLWPDSFRRTKPNDERDYGEYFITRQAARVLGVTTGAIKSLRNRGRLRGYQRPRKACDGVGNKWWFYRKEDVYRLVEDPAYLRNRDRGKVSQARFGRGGIMGSPDKL